MVELGRLCVQVRVHVGMLCVYVCVCMCVCVCVCVCVCHSTKSIVSKNLSFLLPHINPIGPHHGSKSNDVVSTGYFVLHACDGSKRIKSRSQMHSVAWVRG